MQSWLLTILAAAGLVRGNFFFGNDVITSVIENAPAHAAMTVTKLLPVTVASIATIEVTANIMNTVTMVIGRNATVTVTSSGPSLMQPTILPPIIPVGTTMPATAVFTFPTGAGQAQPTIMGNVPVPGGVMITQTVETGAVNSNGEQNDVAKIPGSFLALDSHSHSGYHGFRSGSWSNRYHRYRPYYGYSTSYSGYYPFYLQEQNKPVKKVQARRADAAQSYHHRWGRSHRHRGSHFYSRRFRSSYPLFIQKRNNVSKKVQPRRADKAESYSHRDHSGWRRPWWRRRWFHRSYRT